MNIIRILGNGSAGFIISIICAVNLALGSLVMTLNPKIYPALLRFDLNYFFRPAMLVHSWLYLLFGCFFLLGMNKFFSTLGVIVNLLNNGYSRDHNISSRYGSNRSIAIIFSNLALIAALLAFLYDGFSGESKLIQIGNVKNNESAAADVPGLGSAHINSLNKIKYPDGSLKDTHITVTFDLKDDKSVERLISYNSPALFNYFMKGVVIQEGGVPPSGIILNYMNGKEVFLPYKTPVKAMSGSIEFTGTHETMRGISVAHLKWVPKIGSEETLYMAMGEKPLRHNIVSAGGVSYKYLKSIEAKMFHALVVYNPAIPLILTAVFFMIVSLTFMLRSEQAD